MTDAATDIRQRIADELAQRRTSDIGAQVAAEYRRRGITATRTPDGRSVAPGTTEADAAGIPPGMVFDPRTGGYVDTALAAERMGAGQGAAASYLAGTPFIGESVDEGMGAVDAALTGRNPEIAQEIFRQSREQFGEAHPGGQIGAEIAGGVAGSLPIVAAVPGAFPAGLSTAKTAVLGGGLGAAAGLAEGAAQGYGRGRTPEDRARRAGQGAQVGAMMGGAIGAAGPVVFAAIKGLVGRVLKSDVREIAASLGISVPAARVVRDTLKAEDWPAAERAMRAADSDAMLADAGENTGALLDMATQTGGEAMRIGRTRVGARAGAQQDVLVDRFNAILGVPKGVKTAARDIAASTAPARREAYTAAYAQPVDYSTGAWGENVMRIVDRVPQDDLRAAVTTANKLMQGTGEEYRQILLRELPNGEVAIEGLPSLMQLDYLKRGLNALAEGNVDQFGRKTDLGRMYAGLARDLRDTLRDNVDAYKTALKVGGDKIEMDEALDIGSRLFNRRTSLEDVKEVMEGASVEARQAAAVGVRNQLEALMSEVKATLTDSNVDAREAAAAIKALSSRANREKLAMAVGPARAAALLREIDRAAPALELRAILSTNSKTAVRKVIREHVDAVGAPSVAREILGEVGNPLDAAKRVTQILAGVDEGATAEFKAKLYGELADALTGIRGKEAMEALAVVKRAMAGQPIKEADAIMVGKVLTELPGTILYEIETRPPPMP